MSERGATKTEFVRFPELRTCCKFGPGEVGKRVEIETPEEGEGGKGGEEDGV